MFTITPELHTLIINHTDWMRDNYSKKVKSPEPVNPWPGIAEQCRQAISDIKLGWGNYDEVCVDYLQDELSYDTLRTRYKVGALDSQEILDRLEQFKVLHEYAA